MKKPFKTYQIWKLNAFVLDGVWTRLKGFGDVKARTQKEAQSRVDRKMRSGQHEGWCFEPRLLVTNHS